MVEMDDSGKELES